MKLQIRKWSSHDHNSLLEFPKTAHGCKMIKTWAISTHAASFTYVVCSKAIWVKYVTAIVHVVTSWLSSFLCFVHSWSQWWPVVPASFLTLAHNLLKFPSSRLSILWAFTVTKRVAKDVPTQAHQAGAGRLGYTAGPWKACLNNGSEYPESNQTNVFLNSLYLLPGLKWRCLNSH